MKKFISYSVLALLAPLIVACGGGDRVTFSSDIPKPSAEHVIKQLQAAGVPIDASQELTATNDPNKLLGRPGQYTGKAFFHDTRLPAEKNSLHPELMDSDSGGSVEVFASEADAKRRAEYVRSITQGNALFAEYSYLHGTVFIRVTKKLTPEGPTGSHWRSAARTRPSRSLRSCISASAHRARPRSRRSATR